MSPVFLIMIPAGYLVGAIPMAYLLSRWRRGIDIRRYGSGNVGASNVIKTAGKKLGLAVFVFDVSKGAIIILLAGWLGLELWQQIVVGLLTIAGHNWPVFLRFNGGRGIATSLGVALVMAPVPALIALSTALTFGFSKNGSGGFSGSRGVAGYVRVFSRFFGVQEHQTVTWGFAGLFLIMIVRRLMAPDSEYSSTVSKAELVFNRMFLDRDIRSRSVWINRNTAAHKEGLGI
ncbi:putative membrane spanning protein [Dehalococcoides mccartyi]|uniref:Glycerol-3-phosphate acyltransferase n=1 Tax=Dehalococcoides mccartyi TaxID=61435 RepID=A0A328EQY7_9CHLR|nr:putative membrane spanning protein [Dehalococcoides mccartyi]